MKNNKLSINGKMLSVELANTPFKRSIGLMHRKYLDSESGMLFIFPENKKLSFWMKDTHIPLSIAYINVDGIITSIENLAPYDNSSIKSQTPCRYALEVNQGWFEKNKINVGDKIKWAHERKEI